MSTLFHPLRVRSILPDTEEAVIVSFEVPPELRDVFGFTQGQYLTLRHDIDGQDLRRSYSICAGLDDGELRVGVRKVSGGVFSNWINAHLQPGDTDPGHAAAGPLLRADRSGRAAPPRRHRRRQRHHADPVDHEDGARARAAVALHADLRQPQPEVDDVQGRDRRPEEPLPDAAGPAPCVLRRAHRRSAEQRRDGPREDRRIPGARWYRHRPSTTPSSAARTR